MSQESVPVEPHETLYMPMRRRSVREYVTTPEGNRELHIFFGVKEITLDEPDLLSFGEALLEHDQFMAGSATAWSVGEPYPWERVRELLEALLAEDILSREAPKPSSEVQTFRKLLEAEATRAAPVSPCGGTRTVPGSWSGWWGSRWSWASSKRCSRRIASPTRRSMRRDAMWGR